MLKRITFLILLFLPVLTASAFQDRPIFKKPLNPVIRNCDRWNLLVLKFKEGTGVRLRNGKLVSQNRTDLSDVYTVLANYNGTRVERLFMRPELEYDREKEILESKNNKEYADLNLYFAIGPKTRKDASDLLQDLNNLEIVECVYPEPVPSLPVISSNPFNDLRTPPDYVESQDYLEESPIGINAYEAWTYEGGRGENVQMIDVELAWVWDHVDLPTPFFTAGTPSSDVSYLNHGTAVLGEIGGRDNGFGITGIAPEVILGGVAVDIDDYPDNLAAWFDLAGSTLDEGDVWLIELHAAGPGGDFIAMEYWQANFDAIAASTGLGRICVEAAGNGSADFDNSIYESRFDRSVRDSMAIIVGAGTPVNMDPEWFTNYGTRIDVNAWGSEIVTLGYGDLYDSEGMNAWYTSDFGGTSGASPIVVGAACVAQSIYKGLTRDVLSPETLRAAMVETGAPQPEPVTQIIGPRPNLEELLQHEIFRVQGVFFDQTFYKCSDSVQVLVVDPSASGIVSCTAYSDTELTGETITCSEVSSGRFEGQFTLNPDAPASGDNEVSVTDGDSLSIEYAPLTSTDSAGIDCESPEITNITVTDVTFESVQINWVTDEESDSYVMYGMGTPSMEIYDSDSVTEHSVIISDLQSCTDYMFWVQSDDKVGNRATDDNAGINYSFTTYDIIYYLDEPLDTDPGWEISGGDWAFGQPTGHGGQYGSPDPVSGYTGNNVYGYNLNGDYPVNLPEHHLTLGPLDLSQANTLVLSFYRWLGVETNSFDHAYLRISTNGSTWTTIYENPDDVEDNHWIYQEFDITSLAAGQSQVWVRWTMGVTDDFVQYCGWNIDDIQIYESKLCGAPTPTPVPTFTPVPTNTPTHTPAPTETPECTDLGVELELGTKMIQEGDLFWVKCTICNTGDALTNVPVLVLLDVYGEFWCAPSWKHLETQGLDNYILPTLSHGSVDLDVIEPFTWPSVSGQANGLFFHAAMTNPEMSELIGSMDSVEFGYK